MGVKNAVQFLRVGYILSLEARSQSVLNADAALVPEPGESVCLAANLIG